jgi:RNA polymerase sigma-70 factor (ECF subfamily)
MAMQAERPETKTGASEMLLREHGDAVGRVCTALLGDAATAEAAVEETFVAAADAARPDGVTERAWIFGIARLVCARRLETGATSTLESADTMRDPDGRNQRAASERARLELAELKPTEREAVILWRIGGLTAAEIAHACKTDETTARARVGKALARLRTALGDEA